MVTAFVRMGIEILCYFELMKYFKQIYNGKYMEIGSSVRNPY